MGYAHHVQDFEDVAARAALIASLPPIEQREQARRSLGVTVGELARLVGCSRKFIRAFEKGETVPTGVQLVALSRFYDAAEGRFVPA